MKKWGSPLNTDNCRNIPSTKRYGIHRTPMNWADCAQEWEKSLMYHTTNVSGGRTHLKLFATLTSLWIGERKSPIQRWFVKCTPTRRTLIARASPSGETVSATPVTSAQHQAPYNWPNWSSTVWYHKTMHGSLHLTSKKSTWKRQWGALNMRVSSYQIARRSSLMNMTSPHTPVMSGYISKLSMDDMACLRPSNKQMIFSTSVLTRPVTMKPPQLQDYGTTNDAQFFSDL